MDNASQFRGVDEKYLAEHVAVRVPDQGGSNFSCLYLSAFISPLVNLYHF